jgi:hypothetical protein
LAAGVSTLTILSFIIANGTSVYSYEDHIDYCGCFGIGIGETYSILMKTSDALLIDIVMMVFAMLILLLGGGKWRLGCLIQNRLIGHHSKTSKRIAGE